MVQCGHGVVVITTAQLHSTKLELRFCTRLNPARDVLDIRYDEDHWQWSWPEICQNAFRRSTTPQKQFIIIIIIIKSEINDQKCRLWCHHKQSHINLKKTHSERIMQTNKILLMILIMMALSFLCERKILARLKQKTIFTLLCIIMKTSWNFQLIFQIKNLKI